MSSYRTPVPVRRREFALLRPGGTHTPATESAPACTRSRASCVRRRGAGRASSGREDPRCRLLPREVVAPSAHAHHLRHEASVAPQLLQHRCQGPSKCFQVCRGSHYVHSFRSRFAGSRDPHLKQRRAGRVLSSGGPAHGWQRGACPTDPGLPGVPRGMGGRWARRVRAHDQVGLRVPGSCFRQELRAGPGRGTGYFERAQLAGLRHRNTLYVCGLRVARGSPRARVACAASLSGRVLGRCRAARPWHPGRRRRRALLCRCAKQHVRPFTCVLNCLQ